MKYFIGKKFHNKNYIEKKNNLEEIMLEIGLEKAVDETEILISKIKEEICRNKISIKEVLKDFLKFNTIFLEDESQNIIGFLIFDINYKESYIKIYYLCSMETYKGNGKILLDKIKEYSKKADIYKIILTPGLDRNIIKYYIANGFEIEGWEMIYNVKGGRTIRKRKIKKKNKTRKIKNNYL
jgi:hypothetical protein